MKIFLLPILFFLLTVPAVDARVLVDQVGRTVEFDEPLTRVVALAPSLTEISYEVGGGEALVGATRFANVPEAAARLPKVGSYVGRSLLDRLSGPSDPDQETVFDRLEVEIGRDISREGNETVEAEFRMLPRW